MLTAIPVARPGHAGANAGVLTDQPDEPADDGSIRPEVILLVHEVIDLEALRGPGTGEAGIAIAGSDGMRVAL